MVPAHFHDVTDDEMRLNLVKKYRRTTLESILNQFNLGSSYLSHRTCPDN